MPKKSSRRVTISSFELDNFLSEVSQENLPSRRKTLSKNIDLINFDEENMENIDPNLLTKEKELSDLTSKQSKVSLRVAQESYDHQTEDFSIEQTIRNFCKVRRSSKSVMGNPTLISFAKKVYEEKSYPILSHRLLYSHEYEFPSNTFDGKRALLLKLAPMLNDAEKQRQLDAAACEEHTKCKSQKSKSRGSGFEYVETSSGKTLRYDEYEKRYYRFIHWHQYGDSLTQPDLPSLTKSTSEETSINKSNEEDITTNVIMGEKKKVKSTRRATINTMSAQDLLDSCDNDDDDNDDKNIHHKDINLSAQSTTINMDNHNGNIHLYDNNSQQQENNNQSTDVSTSISNPLKELQEPSDMTKCEMNIQNDTIEEDIVSHKRGKHKTRRVTLSPKSARDMLMMAVQDETNKSVIDENIHVHHRNDTDIKGEDNFMSMDSHYLMSSTAPMTASVTSSYTEDLLDLNDNSLNHTDVLPETSAMNVSSSNMMSISSNIQSASATVTATTATTTDLISFDDMDTTSQSSISSSLSSSAVSVDIFQANTTIEIKTSTNNDNNVTSLLDIHETTTTENKTTSTNNTNASTTTSSSSSSNEEDNEELKDEDILAQFNSELVDLNNSTYDNEEESNITRNNDNTDENHDNNPIHVHDDINLISTIASSKNSEEEIISQISANTVTSVTAGMVQDESDVMIAFDNNHTYQSIPSPQKASNNNTLETQTTLSESISLDNNVATIDTSLEVNCTANVANIIPSSEETLSNMNTLLTDTSVLLDYASLPSQQEREETIKMRLFIRMDVIRWKYHWELVSYDAIMSARKRLIRLYG